MALAPRDIVYAAFAAVVVGGLWNLADKIVAGFAAASAGVTS